MKVNAYLSFSGNCEEAVRVYSENLGGSLESIQYLGDSPMRVEEKDRNNVLHSVLRLGDSVIMACDAPGRSVSPGNNFSLSVWISPIN